MKRVLVANRGEIAVRIMRACRELGIGTAAIYSDADRDAAHVRAADVAAHIGPTEAAHSYLDIERVVAAAVELGADAVHPGYGFLSENPAFAARCADAGLTFIGPTADAMRALGDKQQAKLIATAAHVPTVPTWPIDSVPADAFPVLVKASAGGGGRGMRIVRDATSLQAAVESAAREAQAGFGDDTLLVERLLEGARHIEVQLLADQHGTCLYVGDRDCSLQRRHQKVVEEAPAPGLDPQLRREIGEAAVRIARQAGYTNAGTAEFLVDRDGNFYFLELNARLQVEHPATELAFGLDLVHLQLQVAQGMPLELEQADLQPVSHAIEVRLYAEDPVTFLPTGGILLDVRLPQMASLRIDHAMVVGSEVSLAYDPLLGKLIASGDSREEARRRLVAALQQTVVLGSITNAALLLHALQLPDFIAHSHSTDTLEANLLAPETVVPSQQLVSRARRALLRRRSGDTPSAADPFTTLGGFRIGGSVTAPHDSAGDDHVAVATHGDRLWFSAAGITYEVARNHIESSAAGAGADAHGDHAALTAPMPGKVIKALREGEQVASGEPVVVLEAMKMENAIAAPFDGTVAALSCKVGDTVAKGTVLAEVQR